MEIKTVEATGTASHPALGRTFAYDLEIYPNYFLAVFKEVRPGSDVEVRAYGWQNLDPLRAFIAGEALTLVGYNNFLFDDPLLRMIVDGRVRSQKDLHALVVSHFAATEDKPSPLRDATYDHSTWTCVDLMQILGGPGRAGSLKSHQVRLAMPSVQDLPFAPETKLSEAEKEVVKHYCQNDVNATERLYFDCRDLVATREKVAEQYPAIGKTALRRSNASIAEEVLKCELTLRAGFRPHTYIRPPSAKFDPSQHLATDIRFRRDANNEALQRLQEQTAFSLSEWRDELCERFIFVVGPHQLALTAGGLHTDNPALCVRSSTILEYDVSSYYPSLLRKFGRSPKGLPDKWIEIVNEMTDKRLDLKARGEKAAADVHKIIINSIYGKLGDKFSINRDESLLLQVVINGQLYLLMLIERLSDAGFEVIAANTDGIYVNAGDRVADAQTIADQWMADTGFKLESKTSTIFASLGVNDYALYEETRGWFHKKGAFGLGNRTKPIVVSEAVLNSISTGEPPETFIKRATSVFDFLYSSTATGKGVTLKHGDTVLQKTNRWYKSTEGLPIERITAGPRGTKSARVANSDGCRIANVLSSSEIPNDLDYSHYIAKAESSLADIQSGATPHSVTNSTLVEKASKARAKGFLVVPKGIRGNEKAGVLNTYHPETVSYWSDVPLEEANWGAYEGFGAYTGKEFNLVGIDIDDPDKAMKVGLYESLGKSGVVAQHGDGSAADVRAGKHRGTLLFKYSGDAVRSTAGSFLADYGFEILYGKKVAQLAGYHPTRERYRYSGKLTNIPKLLLNRLEWMVTDREEPELPHDAIHTEGILDQLSRFKDAAEVDDEYASAGGRLTLANTRDHKVHLKGLCIGRAQHTNLQSEQEMTITSWKGRIKVSCFHQTCEAIRRKWEAKIGTQVVLVSKPKVAPERIITTEDMEEVAAALNDTSPAKLIIAPTGSGKSYGIANYIAPFLDASSGNSDKFAIICSSKDEMKQMGEKLSEILNTDNINGYGIELIEATKSLYVRNARSVSSVSKGTRVAITHYTYVSRRKFSPYYYAFLKFIDANTHVFVDEFDAFVDYQTAQLQLGSRWRSSSVSGITKHVRLSKCGMFHHFNNCRNCIMRKYDGYRISLDKFNNPIYEPVGEFTEGEAKPKLPHIPLEESVLSKVFDGPNEVRMLKQADDPGALKFDDDDEPHDFLTTFEDHLKAAYLPTIHRPAILWKGSEITRDELVRKYSPPSGGEMQIPDDDRRELQFPSRPCNALTVTLIDRRPLTHMSQAKTLTALTATITPLREQFLANTVLGLKKLVISPKPDRKMDRIIVVGMVRQLPVTAITGGDWNLGARMLRFRETEADAVQDYQQFKGSNIVVKMGISKREYWGSSEQSDDHRILLTYSFGSLGRGIDFGHYDVVNVNASIYKPISAYVTDDPAVIRLLINEDRTKNLTQNVGRILRRPANATHAVKIVILEEMTSKDEFDVVAAEMQPMSNDPVESWWVPDFLSNEELCECLTKICADKGLPAGLATGVSDLSRRAKELVDQGCDKKTIKLKLRWATTRKRIEKDEVKRIEAEIDQLLEMRPPEVRRKVLNSPDKADRKRERRLMKIRQLIKAGKTDGQVRGDMKVNDKRKAWDEPDQHWFESALAEERLKTALETAPPQEQT